MLARVRSSMTPRGSGSSPSKLNGGDSGEAITKAMLRSEVERFVNGRLQEELAKLKASILDELRPQDDDQSTRRPLREHLERIEGKPIAPTSSNPCSCDEEYQGEEVRRPSVISQNSSIPEEILCGTDQFPNRYHYTAAVAMDEIPPFNPHDDHLSELSATLAESHELSDEKFHWHLAVATLEIDLQDQLRFGFDLDKGSVYGAAVALPQIARCAKWPRMLLGLCARTYLFLLISYIVEMKLLYLVWKEENVMDRFAGQMNLCDFGAHLSQCPESQGCEGPLGSRYTAPRLYDWNIWSTRSFVKDSLAAVFPDKVNEIAEKVDPGEYGMENYECRVLCCFVFVLAIMEDIFAIVRLSRLLCAVPSSADTWIKYGALPVHERDDHEASFDHIRLKVSGIPIYWKVINVALILIPRILICGLTLKTGIHFLMESAVITDGIVNALALSFILSMPGLVQNTMSTRATRNMMAKLETYRNDKGPQTCLEILSKHLAYQRNGDWRTLMSLLPIRFMCSIILTCAFVVSYYVSYCTLDKHGRWVSKTMRLPSRVTYHFYEFLLNALFPLSFPLESAEEPYWQCPDKLECK